MSVKLISVTGSAQKNILIRIDFFLGNYMGFGRKWLQVESHGCFFCRFRSPATESRHNNKQKRKKSEEKLNNKIQCSFFPFCCRVSFFDSFCPLGINAASLLDTFPYRARRYRRIQYRAAQPCGRRAAQRRHVARCDPTCRTFIVNSVR